MKQNDLKNDLNRQNTKRKQNKTIERDALLLHSNARSLRSPLHSQWLLNLLTSNDVSGPTGCQPIVLTGDYHFGDIKTACGGPDTLYGASLGIDLSPPNCVVQHMASGMTHTPAATYHDCDHPSFLKDHSGLREEAGQDECSIITGPNWGEIVYDGHKKLSIRSRGEDGEIVTETELDVSDRIR